MSAVYREVMIDRPAAAVFDYLADMRHLPEWMSEDFERVVLESPGPPAVGTQYRYNTRGGRVEGVFSWTELQRPVRLQWHGPPVRLGPVGSVEGGGKYVLETADGATRVKVMIQPTFHGPLRLIAPLTRLSIRRRLVNQVEALKRRLES